MRNDPDLSCQGEERRDEVRQSSLLGLDYVEVCDDLQRTLCVVFLGKAPAAIGVNNLRIDGGRRVRDIRVLGVTVSRSDDPERDDRMEVRVDRAGDFSTYCVSVVNVDENGRPTTEPMTGFDPRYASVAFTFKADCPSDLDCQTAPVCPPATRDAPEINYLAKDYQSFRQLILDRLALLVPDWRERHVPDIGIALVEVLAYVGDYLSYYQDAVATEAYLDTARQRISVRRHARFVDYALHEGCNARAWVVLWVSEPQFSLVPDDFYVITDPGIATTRTVLDPSDLPPTLPHPFLVFEPLVEDRRKAITLREAHNEVRIYTWSDTACCLAKGATAATLVDPGTPPANGTSSPTPGYAPSAPATSPTTAGSSVSSSPPASPAAARAQGYALDLQPGDVVIFEEVKGPKTGNPADADPTHRHAVRLTAVTRAVDLLDQTLVVEIEWAQEDALPFAVCVSSVGLAPECEPIADVSVVRGNVVLVDHGEQWPEDLPAVPFDTPPSPPCGDPCAPPEVTRTPGWYRPILSRPEITFSAPLPTEARRSTRRRSGGARPVASSIPAARLLAQDVRQALPQVVLYGIPTLPDGTPAFAPTDIDSPEKLAHGLAAGTSPQAIFLRQRLSPTTLKLLAGVQAGRPTSVDLRQALIMDLETIWPAAPRSDLLASGPDDRHFVVEVDDQRQGHLRFGDGELGRSPDAGMTFRAVYRTGSGPAGNTGPDTISRIVFRNARPIGVEIRPRNPLPGTGGTAPEPIAEAKLFAPRAFRKQLERAITADDYAALARAARPSVVQRAAGVLRWTGSWYEAHVGLDPLRTDTATDALLADVSKSLAPYRRMGHDLRVTQAQYVPLAIAMSVCVLPHYLRGHVEAALLDAFSARVLPDGRLGFFHPDNLSFGDSIYLSRLVAAAQAVTGVQDVTITVLERLGVGPRGEIERGVLAIGPLEIAQLDNDPSFPEHGTLALSLGGGR